MITAMSTPRGRKKIIVESRAAINPRPHHDRRKLNVEIRNDRIGTDGRG